MTARNYWLDLFTWTTWQEFLAAGGDVSGFSGARWKTVPRLKPGDFLLCYLTGVASFIGILEVVSLPYRDESPIWKDAVFPCRVKVKVVLALTPETAVPIVGLRDQLSIFGDGERAAAWTGHVRGSPTRWKDSDGEAVVQALRAAKDSPVSHEVDPRKLARRPKLWKAKMGPVTIPERDKAETEPAEGEQPEVRGPTLHEEVQWLLLRLGNDMALDVWVARNDRGREVNGNRFADILRLKERLPLQFDEATNRTIELIDVLWLKGNAIVAAFEIETSTSIYSGLLRMSDLIAMQPNLNIPLYLVAPIDRRDKVFAETNRPTFSRLSPPLNRICKFMPISSLREQYARVQPFLKHLKPEFVDEFCEVLRD
jgi:hypothetical protein